MRRSALLAALVLAALAVLAAVGGSSAAGRDRPAVTSGFRLELFESCDELLSYARENTMRLAGPYGLPYAPSTHAQRNSKARSPAESSLPTGSFYG